MGDSLLFEDRNITLHLAGCSIGKQGATALAKALPTNKSLKVLNLDENDIEIDGAVALAEALGRNESLTELSLAGEWPRVVASLFQSEEEKW